ncbi:MAG: C2H2-type zinc finger protein [Candidatus Bathyarchaeia archaeon]
MSYKCPFCDKAFESDQYEKFRRHMEIEAITRGGLRRVKFDIGFGTTVKLGFGIGLGMLILYSIVGLVFGYMLMPRIIPLLMRFVIPGLAQ